MGLTPRSWKPRTFPVTKNKGWYTLQRSLASAGEISWMTPRLPVVEVSTDSAIGSLVNSQLYHEIVTRELRE